MKAAVVSGAGRPPLYADFEDPTPADGEVVVAVAAAALSPLARGRAAGSHYSASAPYPFVAGVDGVGRLDDGRRVYFMLPRAPFGTMAQRSVVGAGHWTPVPDALDDATAAAIANPGMSSWAALEHRAHLTAGEAVLVNGATGAAGSLAVRIARHLGAGRVVATGRNRSVLETIGADETIVLTEDDEVVERGFSAAFADGIDVVLDYLWGPSARSLLVAAARSAPEGMPIRFVQIGSAGGAEIGLPAAVLRSSSVEMKGSGLGSVSTGRLVSSIAGVLAAAAVADLTLAHDRVPLSRVADTWAGGGDRIVYMVD